MLIDAKMVGELRKRTGLPMMKCKKALQEADGDIEVAADNLRKQGVKASEKVAARELKEGLVFVHREGSAACAVSLMCQTDFGAKADLVEHTGVLDPEDLVVRGLLRKERGSQEPLGRLDLAPVRKLELALMEDVEHRKRGVGRERLDAALVLHRNMARRIERRLREGGYGDSRGRNRVPPARLIGARDRCGGQQRQHHQEIETSSQHSRPFLFGLPRPGCTHRA